MKTVVHAAVGVLRKGRQVLLASRPEGKVYAGYWEFPGGKVEPGEAVVDALARELHEELGITVTHVTPWLTRTHDYPHAFVHLHFYMVWDWQGELHPHEGQQFAWHTPGVPDVAPMLPANFPLLKALQLPDVLSISAVQRMGEDAFLRCLAERAAAGLDWLQWREKNLDENEQLRIGRKACRIMHEHGGRMIVHGAEKLARAMGADGMQLSGAQVRQCSSRPEFEWVGASCHDAAELARAAELQLDYVLLSPVKPTASHPGEPAMGWESFAALLRDYSVPAFALGGMTLDDLGQAREQGAQGIALLREAWAPCSVA